MKRLVCVAAIALMLTGASDNQLSNKKYVPPSGSSGIAKFIFLKNGVRLSMMRGDFQYFGLMDGSTCGSTKKLITYSGGIGGNTEEKLVSIASGNKIRIVGAIQKQTNAGYQMELYSTCTNISSFTPVQGHSYVVRQDNQGSGSVLSCTMSVNDADARATPLDLVVEDAPSCRSY